MMPVARILDLTDISPRQGERLRRRRGRGQRVDIVVPGMNTLFSSIGRVGAIEPANRTFDIVVPMEAENRLLPNQFVSRINDLHVDTAMPSTSSCRTARQGLHGNIEAEGRRSRRLGTVLILGGLTPGTSIIDRGAGRVVEGSPSGDPLTLNPH